MSNTRTTDDFVIEREIPIPQFNHKIISVDIDPVSKNILYLIDYERSAEKAYPFESHFVKINYVT